MSVGQCDVTLSKADQILGALIHPLSVKFLQNNCPWDRTETLSHWKSFVLLRRQGGALATSSASLARCTSTTGLHVVFNGHS